MSKNFSKGVQAAIKGAGGKKNLATGLEITVQSIDKWQRVPRKRIVVIERLFGVPREKLAPELYRK